MGLVGTVKNIFVRVWAWLERFVEEEAAYQAKIAAEKIAAKKISGAKKKAKFVLSKEDGNQANPDLESEDSGYNL